jgi:tRNA1Val (adenine37-N6)-methyltransferase
MVEDDRSTMQIGTDAVLLGIWAEPENVRSILEIGTGCGVISLMLAQRLQARIDAIDTDENSILQAASNFMNNPWGENLRAIRTSLQDFGPSCKNKYDLILTNPPFFTDSLKSPHPQKNLARHDNSLSRRELLDCVKPLLEEDGLFLVILPAEASRKFSAMAEESELFIRRQMNIRPKQGKLVNRILTAYGFSHTTKVIPEELVLRNEDGKFTTEYITFTSAYYFSLR